MWLLQRGKERAETQSLPAGLSPLLVWGTILLILLLPRKPGVCGGRPGPGQAAQYGLLSPPSPSLPPSIRDWQRWRSWLWTGRDCCMWKLLQEVQTCPLTKQKDKLSQTPTDFEDTNLVHICLVVIILTIISLICQESLSEDVKHLNLVWRGEGSKPLIYSSSHSLPNKYL